MPTTVHQESTVAPTDLWLTQTRVIRAPRARVYEAWTNPEVLKQWFGSARGYCSAPEIDSRVGGKYRFEMTLREPSPESSLKGPAMYGHFTSVIPNERLVFTWVSDLFPGEESLVTVSLKDVSEGTQLTLVHERFQTAASRDAHGQGWSGALPSIAKLLEG